MEYIYIKLSVKQATLLLGHLDEADECIFGTDIYENPERARDPKRKSILRIQHKIESYLDGSMPRGF